MDGDHAGRWRIVLAVIAVAAFIVSVLAIVVPWVASWSERGSDEDSVVVTPQAEGPAARLAFDPTIGSLADMGIPAPRRTAEGRVRPSAQPVRGKVIYDTTEVAPEKVVLWNVPVTAPLSTFPVPPTGECGARQLAWLERYATQYDGDQAWVVVRLSSSATYGSAVSLTNIRAIGTLTPATPTVSLSCRAVGGDAVQMAVMDLAGDVAVYSDRRESGEHEPGTIVTVNLSPGEIADLHLELVPHDESFSGKIVARMVSPENRTIILAKKVRLPAAPRTDFALTVTSGVLECQNYGFTSMEFRPADEIRWECTLTEAESIMRRLEGG